MTGPTPADDTPASVRDRPNRTGIAGPLGLIGLGTDGIAVALRLRAAGFRVLAWDDDAAHRDAYRAAAETSDLASAAELANRCTIVLLLQRLREDAATVHDTLIDGMAPGGLVVDMGPSLPGETRRMAAELAGRGLRLVDALLLQGDPPLVIAGGAEADLALAAPALAALGELIETGPVGSAQALSALIAELETPMDRASLASLINHGRAL